MHAGESAEALLLAFNIFLLLAAYHILKTVRASLILSEGGAENKKREDFSSAREAAYSIRQLPGLPRRRLVPVS